jgi:hypothetical protein
MYIACENTRVIAWSEHPFTDDDTSLITGMYPDSKQIELSTPLTVADIHDSAGHKFTVNLDETVSLDVVKRISANLDKPEILADGTDTATITATVDDPTSTEMIELYNGATLVDSQSAVNGLSSFEITMTAPGTITLTVKSTTKYGQRDSTIEGV